MWLKLFSIGNWTRSIGDDAMDRDCVFDSWLASGFLPSEWLIPLLYQMNSSHEIYESVVVRKENHPELIPEKYRARLLAGASKDIMQKYDKLTDSLGIRSLTIMDEDYPEKLRNLSDPPGILFYLGDVSCISRSRSVSMVGSRSASYAGLKASRKIAGDLSRYGIVIVSGFAYGIDTECHWGCLEGGSPTIAVIGCGPDQNYPAGNEKLKSSILDQHGLILSEYPPGTKPLGNHFPYRNRIISALSDAVILMEAKIRSGSMTTIAHALKQGKDVFAYPGDPSSPFSEANRIILREGARYFTTANDILEDMNWLDNQSYVGHNNRCSSSSEPEDSNERVVYNALLKGSLGFDELVQATGMNPSELLSVLTIMQIKKRIEPLPGKRYNLLSANPTEKEYPANGER